MLRLKRIIRSQARFFFSLSLLLVSSRSLAILEEPNWFHSTTKKENFWQALSQDFSLSQNQTNPYIQKQIHWYQRHPHHLERILKKASPIIQYVYQQTSREHLPAELVLIPIIESQYNPTIAAKSGATGLWQMMPGTAAKFGLRVDHHHDGRRDVTASTKAALRYLCYLYRYFHNDWLLALAAYEAGEGRIQAITRHGHDYWQLPVTKNYVPRLLAIAEIIKEPYRYHISLPRIADRQVASQTWDEARDLTMTNLKRGMNANSRKNHESHAIRR